MQDEDTLREVAKDCVHCGFCLPACPTYQLWAEEMDSPRGRIYLVNQLLDGAELTAAAAEHFDRCLGCMACMTACPSGVQYDQLIEAARVWTEEARSSGPAPVQAPADGKRPVRDRIARAAIFSLFPYPRRLRAMTADQRGQIVGERDVTRSDRDNTVLRQRRCAPNGSDSGPRHDDDRKPHYVPLPHRSRSTARSPTKIPSRRLCSSHDRIGEFQLGINSGSSPLPL